MIPSNLPDRCALLPVTVAGKFLTRDVLTGQEHPAQVALLRASTPISDTSARWDVAPVRELLEEAMHRFSDRHTQADAWLSGRLHATLRMTRSEAANKELWSFLALVVAPDYVMWRHRSSGKHREGAPGAVSAARFIGSNDTQAFARLWWAAELFRDGTDYRPAELACANQDLLNTALRLAIIDHRPTALALVRVLQDLADGGATRMGDRANALCSAINAAGGTLMYDVLAPDDLPDNKALLSWIDDADGAPPVPWDRLPDGPDDGAVPEQAVGTLTRLFEQFQQQSSLRDRTVKRSQEEDS
ncbi:DUF6339 family protein [Streptacidiphilus albus]|uniref:DUF6339 family protein n=1 Tax=Streptacidiphilus albus TaxID=105425 RepID=UPI00054BD4F0|nr:DUF6339 family protein [Streptacidiphilus albus]